MATFGIESNGRLEKTAVYHNGQQLSGVKEIFLNLDENGTFDAIIQYEGSDKELYTKNIFTEYLENLKIVEPSFSEEEAQELNLLEIDSDGDIESASVYYNNEQLDGLVSLYVHIKGVKPTKSSIRQLFSGKEDLPDHPEFKTEFVFRNEDNTLDTEAIF